MYVTRSCRGLNTQKTTNNNKPHSKYTNVAIRESEKAAKASYWGFLLAALRPKVGDGDWK